MTVPAHIERVSVRIEESVAWLTIENPDRRNAISSVIRRDLASIVAALADDESIRVITIMGGGGHGFSSGGDLSGNRTSAQREADHRGAVWSALAKPMVAGISRYCVGAGLLLALRAEIRISDETALFSIPATARGIGFAPENVRLLIDTIGRSAAADLLLTGRRITASEALEIGLVQRVVAPGRLEREVRDCAAMIAANAPLSVRAVTMALRELRTPMPAISAELRSLVERCRASEDYREGRQAFLDKRMPNFVGR